MRILVTIDLINKEVGDALIGLANEARFGGGHDVVAWQPSSKPAFDMFDEFKPELFISSSSTLDDATVLYLANRPIPTFVYGAIPEPIRGLRHIVEIPAIPAAVDQWGFVPYASRNAPLDKVYIGVYHPSTLLEVLRSNAIVFGIGPQNFPTHNHWGNINPRMPFDQNSEMVALYNRSRSAFFLDDHITTEILSYISMGGIAYMQFNPDRTFYDSLLEQRQLENGISEISTNDPFRLKESFSFESCLALLIERAKKCEN